MAGYYCKGVRVPGKVYWEPHKLSKEDLLGLSDATARQVAMECMGWELVLSRFSSSATLVDQNPDSRIGALYRVEVAAREQVHLLRVACATLPRHYVLRVPPQCRTALEANAWTWNLRPENYRPEDQS